MPGLKVDVAYDEDSEMEQTVIQKNESKITVSGDGSIIKTHKKGAVLMFKTERDYLRFKDDQTAISMLDAPYNGLSDFFDGDQVNIDM